MLARQLKKTARLALSVVSLAVVGPMQAPSLIAAGAAPVMQVNGARFADVTPSRHARSVADQVMRTGDNQGLPFLIIDKDQASVTVFDAKGRAEAAAPVLLGMAKGDRFESDSEYKDMYETRITERITPAGRFLAEAGTDDKGKDVVWIHYDAGIAMHAVLDNPGERRLERLATPTPGDNRISYGCVNVPTDFYRAVIRPLFARAKAVVYVLPDSDRPPNASMSQSY